MSDSMWFIELGTICVTVAVVVRVWWLVVQVLRARNKRRLLSRICLLYTSDAADEL